jgi:hypothetical protein
MTLHYVPAGAEGYSERRVQIQVTNKPNAVESSEHGKLFKRWHTKNKTIVRVTTSSRGGRFSDDDADLIVPILSATYIKNCGLTKILANPIHGDFVKAPFEDKGIESIVDSGGFQMLRGTVDFVEPDSLIKLYNKNANIGMPLDLPVPSSAEPLFFDAVSQMIKANDTYILKGLNKDVDLALISHGSTLARRKARLDVLDRKANVIAIAGLGIKPPPGTDHLTSAVENLMYVINRYHKTARYFHVLGVTSKFWLFLYALLDASKYVKSIGADSVSHRLGALVGQYDTHDFNTVALEKRLTYRRTLPCTCPVCFAIDDIRILNCTVILEAHNLWARAQWMELLGEMAKQYVAGTVTLQAVHATLRLKMSINDFQKLIRYVETIMSTDKFVALRKQTQSKSLFATKATGDHPRKALYTKILTSYGKFHGKKFLK